MGPRRARVRTGAEEFGSPEYVDAEAEPDDAVTGAIVATAGDVPAKRTTNSPKVRTCSRLTVLSADTKPSSFSTHDVDAGNSVMEICSDTAQDSTR